MSSMDERFGLSKSSVTYAKWVIMISSRGENGLDEEHNMKRKKSRLINRDTLCCATTDSGKMKNHLSPPNEEDKNNLIFCSN